jgi:phosphoenolpyruvate phosphomutase
MGKILVSSGDAITAKLVEEAGFDGIWVSGFEACARLGIADNGSITMTEMLNITKPIVEATTLPVYVDVDTGYGNFRRTIKEFENIGVTGICVEDNLPCKENSLWGGQRPLMDIQQFCDKINIPHSIDIIARTEALIRFHAKEEAIARASAFDKAGADIILIHSRETTGNEALEIIKEAKNIIPSKKFAIVPTKFPHLTNSDLFNAGYDMVIWANQMERVKIKAIRNALFSLKVCCSAESIEKTLSATLDDMRNLMPEK